METFRFDHVVIGSGLAGLTYAIKEAEAGGTVCVLTKAELSDSNTRWAQGGIATAVGEADSWLTGGNIAAGGIMGAIGGGLGGALSVTAAVAERQILICALLSFDLGGASVVSHKCPSI